jgi:hypothetical protein
MNLSQIHLSRVFNVFRCFAQLGDFSNHRPLLYNERIEKSSLHFFTTPVRQSQMDICQLGSMTEKVRQRSFGGFAVNSDDTCRLHRRVAQEREIASSP